MKKEFLDQKLGSILSFTDDIKKHQEELSNTSKTIKFLWNRQVKPISLFLDGVEVVLQPDQLMTATYLHHLSFENSEFPLTAILFNREFYCINDHDSEVSCNGILFFGTQDIPLVTIPQAQKNRFDLWHDVFTEEFATPDKIQGDMLQILLKRLIIMTTRLAKEQLIVQSLNNEQIDIIRRFNFLVDTHFRTKRKVGEYAELLFKSPKTLSNLFSIYNQKSPQQIILERLALEAKRLINFTDKQNQEIAYELGFNDPAHFSRFFKKMTKMTPSKYRETKIFSV